MSDVNMEGKNQPDVNMSEKQNEAMTMDTMISGLRQLAAMNDVYVMVLETAPTKDSKQTNLPRRQFLAVFAETDALTQKETGKEMVRENLHRAASVKKDMVYCPCRLCRLTPRGDEELLARYTEAGRAVRETAMIRELYRAEDFPLPLYLSVKTVAALCHFREKLFDNTLPQDIRKRYEECLHRLVQEAHGREGDPGDARP